MNIIEKIIWYTGKFSKTIRVYYHKKTKGRWLWGIIGYIKDHPVEPTDKICDDKELEEIIEKIFNYSSHK